MTMALLGQITLGVYAILLAIGGFIGYAKAGSRPSLIAGTASAVLALIALGLSMTLDVRAGFLVGAGLAMFLLLFFGSRFARSRKFMPGGLMTLVSLAVVVLLAVIVLRAANPTI